ncbi:ABC transporter substrate-binding protein [Flavonifractor plautii]|nr:ABC transporter substrate-binding protein [Flavonifractor plautii]
MSKYGKRAVGLLLTGALCAYLLAKLRRAGGRRHPDGPVGERLRLRPPGGDPPPGGGTDWGVPNPYLHQSRGPGTAKMRLVYGSLLEKDETGDVPWLAERWSMDGNDYTFTLFADAQFQDGAPLTTADVAFTLDYYQEHPRCPTPWGWGTAIWWTTIRWWMSRPSPSP